MTARLVCAAIAATKLATTSRKSELRQSGNQKPLAAAGAKLIATRIGRSMRRFGAAKAAWRWKEPNRLTEGVQGV